MVRSSWNRGPFGRAKVGESYGPSFEVVKPTHDDLKTRRKRHYWLGYQARCFGSTFPR